jgi:hypothetical protein
VLPSGEGCQEAAPSKVANKLHERWEIGDDAPILPPSSHHHAAITETETETEMETETEIDSILRGESVRGERLALEKKDFASRCTRMTVS